MKTCRCTAMIAALTLCAMFMVPESLESRDPMGAEPAPIPMMENAPVRNAAVRFFHDDGSVEIHGGAMTGMFVLANRFRTSVPMVIDLISFYTAGGSAGDEVDVIVYEDPTGRALSLDPTMEILRMTVTLGDEGFQQVVVDRPLINKDGLQNAAFFVAVANLAEGSYKLGIDMSGPSAGISFVSTDDGRTFEPLSSIPILDGIAMIRASGRTGVSGIVSREALRYGRARFDHLIHGDDESQQQLVDDAPFSTLSLLGEPVAGARNAGNRNDLVNGLISASSGSGSCPTCSPALVPGYPQDMNTYGYPTDGGWHHYAVTRASGTVRVFLDGVLKSTRPNRGASIHIALIGGQMPIGRYGGGHSLFNGYLDELRISKGVAHWTEDFTPPSLPY